MTEKCTLKGGMLTSV